MRRLLTLVVGLITTLAVVTPLQVFTASSAQAVEPGSLSSAISSSYQANATVWSMAYANSEIWLAGDFTSLRPPGSAAGSNEQTHTYLAALNSTTGAPVSFPVNHTFTLPSGSSGLPLTAGIVAASPDGSVIYVGGNFAAVDGVTRSHIVAFNTTTGAMTSFAPAVNGRVNAIATAGNNVYIGGTFTKVGSASRTNLAAVSATTGAVLPWSPAAPNNTVDTLAALPDSSIVAIGGYFTAMGGDTTHNKAALVDGTVGSFLPLPGDQAAVPVNSASCVSDVKDVVLSGGAAYFADEGTGGGCFDGTWAANLSDGSLKWVNTCLGATQTVAVVGPYLYKGSHIHDCTSTNTNGDPDNFPQVPVNQNRHVTSESLSNGFLGPWYPNMNAGPNLGPRTMATDGSQLYVGGDFTVINGTSQQGIARFTSTTDYPTPKPAQPIAVPSGANSVNVFAQAPVDLDDPDLTMELFRDGGSTPIASVQTHSLFWKQPIVGFTDVGLATGSQHSYQVEAVETFGTGSSPLSAASAKVTVGASSYANTVLSQNAVNLWRFGEASGTFAADSGPGLNGGTYTGGVTLGQSGAIIGDSNAAAKFDGSTGYFATSQSQPSPTVFSVAAWFKTTTTSGGKIVGFGSSPTGNSSSYDKHVYMTNAGNLVFGVFNGGTFTIKSAKAYNDGNWHEVVGTQGPNGMTLSVDGQRVGSNTMTTNQSYTGYWRVGGDSLNGWPSQPSSNYFGGTIDDVSVYPSALTPSQIAAQYTAAGYSVPTLPGAGTPYAKNVLADSPSLFWRLDEASGVTATDISGAGNNGTYNSGDTLGVSGAINDGSSPADTAVSTNGGDNGVMVSQAQGPSPTAFSAEAWFKTTRAGGKIIGFGDSSSPTGSSNYDKHIYFNSDGTLHFGVWNGEEDEVVAPASLNLTDGNWHSVVGTQDSTGMKLYVDGNLVGQNSVTTNQSYNGYWHVGGDSSWSNNGNDFNGSIDEVAVYPYALTGAQVQSDYTIGSGQTVTPLPPASPAAPTVTSSSSTTADISWAAVNGATSYQVLRSPAGANTFVADGSPVAGTSQHDTNLTPGASYDYEVTASNTGGTSAPSAKTSITLVPGQPTNLSATAASSSEIDLTWTAATGATSYDVRKGVVGSGTFPTDLGTVAGTTFPDTGLNPGDSFDYEIVPIDAAGNGQASSAATGTTTPAQVTGLSGNAASSTEIDLVWNAAAGAQSYRVERAPAGSGNWQAISTTGTQTMLADTLVSPSTGYDYRVAAVNAGGRGAYSSTVTVTTPNQVTPPAKVTGLTANAAGAHEVDLTWTAAATATSYEIDRSSTSATTGFTQLATGVSATSFPDTTAAAGTQYWYKVIASNAAGPGPASDPATATTPAGVTVTLSNTFEGGTNGTAVTHANSGGTSGNALDDVSCSGGAITYSNASPAHAALAALLAPSTAICYMGWHGASITSTSEGYSRADIKLSANPATATSLTKVLDSSFARSVQVNLSKTGKLSILDAAGNTLVTFTNSVPLNQWFRIEQHVVVGASGSYELRLYVGDSTTPLESHAVTGSFSTSIGALQWGALTANSWTGVTIGLDDLAYGTGGWLGAAH